MEASSVFFMSIGSILFLILLISLGLLVIKLYVKLSTGWCRSNVSLTGKTVIITGASSGIGYQTAEDFAKRGAKVILACRDPQRGKDAEDRIKKATDNPNIFYRQLDLASFKSVRQFAENILLCEERLDILVNNAGVAYMNGGKSEDGILLEMQINHFGHFLLTNLLLGLIKSTSNSRIINVASLSARFVIFFNINNLNFLPWRGFRDTAVCMRSKLCTILFTIELAKRLKGTTVTTYSVHPGFVHTEIFRTMPTITKFAWKQTIRCLFKNAIEGAQTVIYCSVAKDIQKLSGHNFHDCHFVKRYRTANNPELPKKLWMVSEQFVHLNEIPSQRETAYEIN